MLLIFNAEVSGSALLGTLHHNAVANLESINRGAQATGGNYAFFTEVPGLDHVGFPWAEVAADGSSVIGKHDGTGGLVSVGTVTAQLLYEIGGPLYLNPDVSADFETIHLEQVARDRVRISGTHGVMPANSAAPSGPLNAAASRPSSSASAT